MIRAITFDFWNTLYADVNFDERLKLRIKYIKNKLSELGYDKEISEIEKVFEETGKKWLRLWEESKAFTPLDITRDILVNLGLPHGSTPALIPYDETVKDVCKGIGEITLGVPPKLIDGVTEFLSETAKEYKIGLISDTGATPGSVLKKVMKNDGILKYFGSFVFSDELGSTKPSKINFASALKPLGVQPQFAVHIGDIEKTDILGAKSFGMKAILFKGAVNQKDSKDTIADLTAESYSGLAKKIKNL